MLKWFKKNERIPFENQLAALDRIGIRLNDGVSPDVLIQEHSKEEYEEQPYYLLLLAMGSEVFDSDGKESYNSNDIWYLDTECIEDHGDYVRVIKRIADLIQDDVVISDISDYVDIENNEARISFEVNGEFKKYDLAVDDDWLDINVFRIFSELLREHGSQRQFFYSVVDQSILVGIFTKEQFKEMRKLINIFIPF